MTDLLRDYEKYLKLKEQYDKEVYLYKAKQEELIQDISKRIQALDTTYLTQQGFSFEPQQYDLADPQQVEQLYQEVLHLCDRLEKIAYNYMNEVR